MTQQHSFFRTLPPSFYWKTVGRLREFELVHFTSLRSALQGKLREFRVIQIRVRVVPQYNDEYESQRKSQVDRLKLRHYYSLPNLMQK